MAPLWPRPASHGSDALGSNDDRGGRSPQSQLAGPAVDRKGSRSSRVGLAARSPDSSKSLDRLVARLLHARSPTPLPLPPSPTNQHDGRATLDARDDAGAAVAAVYTTLPLTVSSSSSFSTVIVPANYHNLHSGPRPGTIIGIVLGAVGAFLLLFMLLYGCVNLGRDACFGLYALFSWRSGRSVTQYSASSRPSRHTGSYSYSIYDTSSLGTASVAATARHRSDRDRLREQERERRRERRRHHHHHHSSSRTRPIIVDEPMMTSAAGAAGAAAAGFDRIVVDETIRRTRTASSRTGPRPAEVASDDDNDEIVVEVDEDSSLNNGRRQRPRRSSAGGSASAAAAARSAHADDDDDEIVVEELQGSSPAASRR